MATFLLFALGLAAASDCLRPNYTLSACDFDANDTRSGKTGEFTDKAFMYFGEGNECGFDPAVLAPIRNIPCRQSCEAGEFFNIDSKARTFECTKCPVNTYSSGGGFLLSGDLGDWSDFNTTLSKLAWVKQTCFTYSCNFCTFSLSHSLLMDQSKL
jgi:hypothetical protein